MVAGRGDGKPIERITVRKKHQQYSAIAEISKKEHGQMAVLYLNNGSAIPLMDLFLRENIPFVRLKEAGENFFTSKVVQDIVYFLRFAINPKDAEAFRHIYYKCGYGFNKNTADWSCRNAKQKDIPITDALIKQLSRWQSLKDRAELFAHKLNRIAKAKPHDAISYICDYWYYSYAKDKQLDIGKAEILSSLSVHEETICGFLRRLAQLPVLIKNYQCADNNPVILSTIHSAKGLEFDTVYIVDVYDGSLPHFSREDAKEQERIDAYEEERRIFYVGITRAKDELYLLDIEEKASSFIDEIIPHDRPEWIDSNAKTHTPAKKLEAQGSSSDASNSLCSIFTVNTKIRHNTYGVGIIECIQEISSKMHLIDVKFEQGRRSQIHLEVAVEHGVLHLL